jgi:hypothetical protein
MKTKEQALDTTQPVELTTFLEGQAAPFVIRGDYEAVAPMAEALRQADEQLPTQVATRTRKVAQAAVEAVSAPIQTGLGRVAVDVKAIVYDKLHRTNFYDLLRDKRNTERDLRFAGSLGLFQEEVCAKHRKALQSVRRVR